MGPGNFALVAGTHIPFQPKEGAMRKLCLSIGLVFATIQGMPAGIIEPITIDLSQMNVTGSGGLPLGRAEGGGYQYVLTQISVSATASGTATLSTVGDGPIIQGTPLTAEAVLSGTATVTFTDIDPTFNFFGLPSSFQRTISFSNHSESVTCLANLARPNYGCLPFVGLPVVGDTGFRVDLPADINGNLLIDFMAVDPGQSQVGTILSSVLQGSNLISTFTTSASVQGAVQDEAGSAPFSLALTGSATANQSVVVEAVPEPAPTWLVVAPLAGLLFFKRRRQSQSAG
jgi:hypothetical protein